MTDPKQELLALIDRLDPERQAILLQYAHGLEQAGPLLEKWVEEFKIAEKRRQHERDLDLLDTPLSSILDNLNGPPEEFIPFLAVELSSDLNAIQGYTELLLKEPKLASMVLWWSEEITVHKCLKSILEGARFAQALNRLPALYMRYLYRQQQETDRNNLK